MDKIEKHENSINKVIDNRYRVIDVIGVGGMAVVLKALDLTMNRTVAIKVLNEENGTDEQAVRRFINESKAVAMLSHPNIVNIFDVAIGERLKYIVMEYIDGITLKDYMTGKGKLSTKEAVHFTEQILQALEHAHEKGVIHRDIKPQNVMLLKNGAIKVTDFGIAKVPNNETITMSDKAIGTVYYISPEQASGKATGTFSDIYSTGVMLYEMTTGRLPFEGESPVSVAMKQINEDPERPGDIDPTVPKGLEQIILKAMSKQPERRFKSAHSMLRAIGIFKNNPNVIFEDNQTADAAGEAPFPTLPAALGKRGGNRLWSAVLKKIKARGEKKIGHSKSAGEGKPVKVTLFPIILGISIAFLIVFGVCAGLIANRIISDISRAEEQSLSITVPDLLGKNYSEDGYETLKAELSGQHLRLIKVVIAEERNENYDYGQIFNTYPSPGSLRKIANENDFCDITVYVNPYTNSTVLPDYTIQNAKKVQVALENKGYRVQVVNREHNTVARGYIFETEPKAGAVIQTGDTVILYASSGTTVLTRPMPELKGKNRTEAENILREMGVEVQTEVVWGSEPAGTVIYQSVAAETVIAVDFSSVKLFISDGTMREEAEEIIAPGTGETAEPAEPVIAQPEQPPEENAGLPGIPPEDLPPMPEH